LQPFQAIDDDSNQTGQMLAGLLQWPQATFASKLEFAEDRKSIRVLREVDGGLQNIDVGLPCVVTADLRLNEPRYATLPNIMKAKKKPIEAVAVDKTGVDVAPRLTIISMGEPSVRKGGRKVANLDELLGELKGKGLA
jgi:electron transfer flavoprotein beta subunit